MERYIINEETMEVIDRFKSNPDLQYYMGNEILIEVGILKEMILGAISKQCSNKEFRHHCLKKLHSIKISNRTYIINSDMYDPSLVEFLGAKCLNLKSIPEKILKTIRT